MTKCPCKQCIIYAICINKKTAGCELTDAYIGKKPYSTRAQIKIKETRDFLKKDVAAGRSHNSGPIRFSNIEWVPSASKRLAK